MSSWFEMFGESDLANPYLAITSKPSPGLNCAKGQELAVSDHGGNWQGRGFKQFLFLGLKRNTDAIPPLFGRLDFCCMGVLTTLWLHLVIVGG